MALFGFDAAEHFMSNSNTFSPLLSSARGYTQYMGILAPLAALLPQSFFANAIWLIVMGSLVELGRRSFAWVSERLRFQYCLTAKFQQGDASYEWLVNFLTEENVWKSTCEFDVTAKNSMRKWGITPGSYSISHANLEGNADYVPQYFVPQLFKWKGYWMEIKKEGKEHINNAIGRRGPPNPMQGPSLTPSATLQLTIYTRKVSVLSKLVEEARARYLEMCRPHVIVHVADLVHANSPAIWNNVKRKPRRSVDTVILEEGVMDHLLDDMRDFLTSEEWYHEAGIPHRRGYLLEGPPGTGKTSTIYSLAGELGLEIFSLSLSSGFLDDMGLQHAVSSAPKGSILVIEDIDCAFPSREEEEEEEEDFYTAKPFNAYGIIKPQKTAVTLSGLLNVIDGVGSDEGKIFFTTTNYVDRLDPALLRPGRIDRRVRYKLATRKQAHAMYQRFFSEKRFGHLAASDEKHDDILESASKSSNPTKTATEPDAASYLGSLADAFAADIPDQELSTAELQGYLLGYKKDPVGASSGIGPWLTSQRAEKSEREQQELARKEKSNRDKARRAQQRGGGMFGPAPPPPMPLLPPPIPLPFLRPITPPLC